MAAFAGVLIVLVLQLAAPGARAEARVALVIGNSAYTPSGLKNPVNDARLMARTLAAEDFDVTTVFDGDSAAMHEAIAVFGRKLSTPGAVALFYYAGHGVQSGGDNYLIPVKADFGSTADVEKKGVALSAVFKVFEVSLSRLNIVLLDACRNNPFETAGRASLQGLAPVVAPSGTIISFATAPGQIARDGSGLNSPYTAALAESIPTPGVTLEDMFRGTRRKVREATGNTQTTWEHSSLLTEFYFHPGPAGDGAQVTVAGEVAAWEKIRASHDPQVFREHTGRFPDGLFAEVAAVRIAKLEAQRSATPWQWMMTGGLTPEKSAAAANAAYEKALRLESSNGAPEALTMVFELYQEAANAGSLDAMFGLARAYDKGRGAAKDLVRAAEWYEKAADRGHAGAMAALGTMREFGDGTRKDLADALRLYRQSSDRGDPVGQTSLGYLYAEGKGVSKNIAEARRLYELAAAQHHPRAKFNLALFKLRGIGGKADVAGAVSLLQDSAEKGHGRSLNLLAVLHDEGRGVPRDAKRAAQFYLKSLRADYGGGHVPEIPGSALSLATRREVQRQLAARGLYRGFAHGFFNRATLQALVVASQQ